MVKGNPVIFSVAFTERAVAVMGLKQGGGIPVPQGPVADYDTLWVDGSPCVLGRVLQGITFLFIHKGKMRV